MKLVLIAVLLMSVAVVAEEKMTIIPITKGRFSGAVRFPSNAKGDQAVVRVFYWANRVIAGGDGKPVHLLLSKEFVIPVIAGGAVAFDEIPADQEQVRNIDVVLVNNVGKQTILASEFRK